MAAASDHVVVAFPGTIRCYEAATGDLLWQALASTRSLGLAVEGPHCYAVDSLPSKEEGGPRLETYDLSTGCLLGKRELHVQASEFRSPFPAGSIYPWLRNPVLHNGVLLLCYRDRVIAFDLETGAQLWELRLSEVFDLSVSEGTVLIGGEEEEPAIYQLDLRTGKILWSLIGEPVP